MSVAALTPLPPPEPPPRSPEFEADLAHLRAAVTTWQESITAPISWIEIRLLPRIFGFKFNQVRTVPQAILVGVLSAALHLVAPVVATTVTATWADAPIWTWAGVALFMSALDVFGTRVHGESSPTAERLFRLPAAIDRDEDLHELVDFTRRWWRARTVAPTAVALTVGVLTASAAAAPDAFRSFHVGSLVMLALLVHEFIEGQLMVFMAFRVYAWESRFAHRLSWLDPVASAPVQALLHTWFAGIGAGSPMLMAYGLSVATLIAPVAPDLLVVPLAGISLIGFVLITMSLTSLRRSVQRIVRRTKEAALESLRERIEILEPRTRELTPAESAELQALLATYAAVREAPTGPSGAQTFGHAVTALTIPALTFFLAVMSEVYAERLLDQLLP
jgi:hypothetical protein